jgi:SAM-dependent methyltransferase
MSKHQLYTDNFYQCQQEGSLRSAEEIVPLIIKLINPKSVIDVGCGVGTWLSVFKKLGVTDILGVDGNWVNRRMLKIPEKQFLPADITEPVRLGRQFDLVMSLEVAEHLPEGCPRQFIDSLIGLGPAVLFSAAIPHQGGAKHQNEQWSDYWAKLFYARDYKAIDCLRKHIWNNEKIQYWYAQNMILFASRDILEKNHFLSDEWLKTDSNMLCLVHPKHYLLTLSTHNLTLKQVLSAMPSAILRAIRFRMRRRVKKTREISSEE